MRSPLLLDRLAKDVLRGLAADFPEHAGEIRLIRVRWCGRLTRAAGQARSSINEITLSKKIWSFEENSLEEFKNTIIHEVAHVLVGNAHGHDATWRAMALKLGCNGEQYHELRTPPRRRQRTYEIACSRCGRPIEVGVMRYRRYLAGTNYHHSSC